MQGQPLSSTSSVRCKAVRLGELVGEVMAKLLMAAVRERGGGGRALEQRREGLKATLARERGKGGRRGREVEIPSGACSILLLSEGRGMSR